MKKDIKLVIFDWSGVISDDRKLVYETNMYTLKQHGKPLLTMEQWLETPSLNAQEFYSSQGVCGSQDELFNLYEKNLNKLIESGLKTEVYPYAQDVLRHLKEIGKKIAVLSCHPEAILKKEACEYKLISFLDLIRGGSKNKTKDLFGICQQLDVKPEAVIYIGDTIRDIRAAKEAGVCSAGICHGYHKKERLTNENPDLLIDCLLDLKKHLS